MSVFAEILAGTAEPAPQAFSGHTASSAGSSAVLAQRIERARSAFVWRAHAKIIRAAEISTGLDESGSGAPQPALAELQNLAHSLCGSAGSFGYDRLSEIAGALEEAILDGTVQSHRLIDLVLEMAAEFLGRVAGYRPDFNS